MPSGDFTTTHWSVVLAAGSGGSPRAAEALEQLCRDYWYPLYAFVRHQGHSVQDAEDLTQEFIARILAHDYIARANPEKGRFRSFLLTGMKYLMCDEHDKATRLKRGGGRRPVSLDVNNAENRYRQEAAETMTPDRLFERSWASTLLERAACRLRDEYIAAGMARVYEQLTEFRLDETSQRPYADAARHLGLSDSAVKSAIRRLRLRHMQIVRDEIAQTVSEPADVDEEVRHLIQIVGG